MASVVGGILLLVMGVLFIPRFQRLAAKELGDYLSARYGGTVKIGRIALNLPKTLVVYGVDAVDAGGDSLLSARALEVDILTFRLNSRKFFLNAMHLDSARLYLFRESDGRTHWEHWLQGGQARDTAFEDTIRAPLFFVHSDELTASWLQLAYHDRRVPDTLSYGRFNGSHTEMTLQSVDIRDLRLGASWSADIRQLKAVERCGLRIRRLTGRLDWEDDILKIEDLQLRLNRSHLALDAQMETGGIEHRGVTNMPLKAQLEETVLDMADLTYFIADWRWRDRIALSGRARGTINALSIGEVGLFIGDRSHLVGSVHVNDLSQWEQAFIEFETEDTRLSAEDIIQMDWFPQDDEALQDRMRRLGEIEFSGSLVGFVTDFVAYGAFRSPLGEMQTDISLALSDSSRYSGSLRLSRLLLDQIFPGVPVQRVSAVLEAEGRGLSFSDLDAHLKGNIDTLVIGEYVCENIGLNGRFLKQAFTGEVRSNDPNFNFDFEGGLDFNGLLPQFNFRADVYHLNLSALGIGDSLLTTVSTHIAARGEGLKPENFAGKIEAFNTDLCRGEDWIKLGNAIVETSTDTVRHLAAFTRMFNLQVNGRFSTRHLLTDLKAMGAGYQPLLVPAAELSDDQAFDFLLVTKDHLPLHRLTHHRISVAPGSVLSGAMNSRRRELSLQYRSDSLMIDSMFFLEPTVEIRAQRGELHSEWFTRQFRKGGFRWQDPLFYIEQQDTLVDLGLSWYNDFSNQGELYVSLVSNDQEIKGGLTQSNIRVSNQVVDVHTDHEVMYRDSIWRLKNLHISRADQDVVLSGVWDPGKDLSGRVVLQQVDLQSLADFNLDLPWLRGQVAADIGFRNLLYHPVFIGNIQGRDIHVEGKDFGDVDLQLTHEDGVDRIRINGSILPPNGSVVLSGDYNLDRPESPLDVMIKVNAFDLALLDRMFTDEVNQFSGRASGNIHWSGHFDDPRFSGKLRLSEFRFHVDYLNSAFIIDDEIVVEPDYFGFNRVTVRDPEGNRGWLTGTAFHRNFGDFSFDLYLEAEKLKVLNTNKYQNSIFYGTGYTSGFANVSGYQNQLNLEMNLTPEKGSVLYLPMDGSREVVSQEFVTFVQVAADTAKTEEEQRNELEGITMDFTMNANQNLDINLVFDEQAGDIMKGNGEGNISVNIDRFGDLSILGKYEVLDGEYLFTLQNVVNKKFNIRRGGTIQWFGDPYAAQLDIVAEYNLRAPLYDILLIPDNRYRRREPVKVIMYLRNELFNPDINFQVDLPNADDLLKTQVNAAMNTEQELNRQVFSLLIFNRFSRPLNRTGETSSSAGAAAAETSTSELLSNQVSNWFSQLSSDVDVGFNYRRGDVLTSQEVSLALSTQLFNERVTIAGNVGVTEKNELNPSGVVGDLSVEYALTKDGRFRLKAFNESADNYYLSNNLSPFIQGIGVFYRQDFDNLDDIWKRFKGMLRKKEEE